MHCERFSASKKRSAVLAFEGWAVKAAMEFEFCTAMDRLEGMKALFESAHVGEGPGAEVEGGSSAIGDNIGARTAFDDVGVDGDATARIVPFFDSRNLCGQFVNGVNAFFRCESGVRSASVNDELRLADPFAASLQ